MAPEQRIAAILRIIYRLKVIDFKLLDRLIDDLQIRLFTRELDEHAD